MNHYFTIDPRTGKIYGKDSEIFVDDNDIHYFVFDIPRTPTFGPFDTIYIEYIRDFTLYGCEADISDSLIPSFRWILPHNVTKESGELKFIIRFVNLDYNNKIKYELRTELCTVNIVTNNIRKTIVDKYMYNCPNCGAPITGDKCEYCGTVFHHYHYY